MGNEMDSSRKASEQSTKNTTELVDMNSYTEECAEEEYIQRTQCCGFEFTKLQKSTYPPTSGKIIWENNFITHCTQVKDEFRWASELIELINFNRQSKAVYFKEINDLKKNLVSEEETEREILISPSEVEQFKNNLKRSVLLSASQTSKYFQDHPNRITSAININGRPSKIDFSRFSNNPYRNSTTGKKLERSPSISSAKSGLRKSIMSFVDDTLSSVFGNQREISKQVANSLQIFLKFSMILEKHFSDPKCMLSQIKKKFIDFMVKNYSDSASIALKIPQFIDSINQFMTILKEAIIDYYNLNSFADGEPYANSFIANEENLLSICNSIFFKDKVFYDIVFSALVKYNEDREVQFKKIVSFLANSPPEKFFVKQKFCLNKKTIEINTKSGENSSTDYIMEAQPYYQCKIILNQLQKSRTPVNKMKIILSCSEMINKQIEKFYDVNGLQRQKWMLDADQVLSIFCYIIVSAKVEHLHTHLFILDNFSTSSQMISIFGYYLSVMNCAVEQLEGDYTEKIESEQSQF